MTLTTALSQNVKFAGDKLVLIALAHHSGGKSRGKAQIRQLQQTCCAATEGFVEQCLNSLREQDLVMRTGAGANRKWVIVDE